MKFLNRIRTMLKLEPEEQVLGYSPSELESIFQDSNIKIDSDFPNSYPKKESLISSGIHAIYVLILIDKQSLGSFLAMVNEYFEPEENRVFLGIPVMQCKGTQSNEKLCYLTQEEFGGVIVKLVTDSVSFLSSISAYDFGMPPPWIVFDERGHYWRRGSMQGAQGYYDDNFFSPYLQRMNKEEREKYYSKYDANQKWQRIMELFYTEEND